MFTTLLVQAVPVTDRTPELAEDAGWTDADMAAWLEDDAETSWRDAQLDAQRERDLERGAS